MLFKPLALLAAFAPLAVLADIEFTSPAAGQTLQPGTITFTWKDSGDSPSISDLKSYQLFLCAGGNTDGTYDQLTVLQTNGDFSTGNSASGSIVASIGGSTANAYFLKMISVATAGGTVVNFSKRFTLSGMTGVFSANAQSGLKNVQGTNGPDTQNNVNSAATATQDDGPFGVPYTLQTGLTRYAPMQPHPGTKITAKSAKPLWPTSSYSIATTFMGPPTQLTTLTQAATYSYSSRENPASPAANPSDSSNDDMAKFLNRWKD
ncbi:hypothetical protein L228DRAFT_248266 [Xylona heveae TC161]|uniref:Uncharacterized protein n=1 Tax=Xylona heveae (strain CBS 132557 / TC161) TaxID=1328760 RepID=A0A165FYT2_XYLHT|nr:hypothetical protein L228DRAFT_248266 [Xylona heveae TC161]KZF21542.1 hypothetical protein L228DRAFT_248266 [Xylona heveae TC161]